MLAEKPVPLTVITVPAGPVLGEMENAEVTVKEASITKTDAVVVITTYSVPAGYFGTVRVVLAGMLVVVVVNVDVPKPPAMDEFDVENAMS